MKVEKQKKKEPSRKKPALFFCQSGAQCKKEMDREESAQKFCAAAVVWSQKKTTTTMLFLPFVSYLSMPKWPSTKREERWKRRNLKMPSENRFVFFHPWNWKLLRWENNVFWVNTIKEKNLEGGFLRIKAKKERKIHDRWTVGREEGLGLRKCFTMGMLSSIYWMAED